MSTSGPVVPVEVYPQVSDVTSLVRTFLNDNDPLINGGNGVVYTDAVLMPFVNSAARKVRRKLGNKGGLFQTEDYYVIEIPALAPNTQGPIFISYSGTPALPGDMITPKNLWEKPVFTPSGPVDFIPMAFQPGALPDVQPGAYLRLWRWSGDQISFIGATQNVYVKIQYTKFLPAVVLPTDPIQIIDAVDAFACLVAGFASASRDAAQSQVWLNNGMDEISDLANQQIRARQGQRYRSRPRRGRNRNFCNWT